VSSWSDVALVTLPALIAGVAGFSSSQVQRRVRMKELETEIAKVRHGEVVPLRAERQRLYASVLAAEFDLVTGIAAHRFKTRDELNNWAHLHLLDPFNQLTLTAPPSVMEAGSHVMNILNEIQQAESEDGSEGFPDTLSNSLWDHETERVSRRQDLITAMRADIEELIDASTRIT